MKGIFGGGAWRGSREGQLLPVCWCSCTQVRKHQWQEVDSSYFIIERGFFWGIYKKKGLGLLGA